MCVYVFCTTNYLFFLIVFAFFLYCKTNDILYSKTILVIAYLTVMK